MWKPEESHSLLRDQPDSALVLFTSMAFFIRESRTLDSQ